MSEDAIFLVEQDRKLVRMNQGPYASEATLQALLADYPDLLAGYPIDPEAPRRWILVDREVGLAHEAGGPSGPSILWFYPKDGAVQFDLEALEKAELRERVATLREQLGTVAGRPVAPKYPWLTCEALAQRWQLFEGEVLPTFVQAHRERAPGTENSLEDAGGGDRAAPSLPSG